MSFVKYKPEVEDGDTVIIFLRHDQMYALKVKKDETYQTVYGALQHNDLIGKKYGSKVNASKGWVYVLHPTPELWTANLPHRTQILYTTDISMIILQLDLKPGSVVVESGTGSGSLSHALIRAIAPTGHLHTFEFHEQRAEKARVEFRDHGLSDLVTVTHRDVCADGFGLEGISDAVFLDLPRPWEAITSAKQSMKPQGGRICSFSPCVEQTQRVCEKLTEDGFSDIVTLECLLRTFDIKTINMPEADLGQIKTEIEDESEKECQEQGSDREQIGDVTPAKIQKMDASEARLKAGELQKQTQSSFVFKTCRTPHTIPGHTGYLTFATLYVG